MNREIHKMGMIVASRRSITGPPTMSLLKNRKGRRKTATTGAETKSLIIILPMIVLISIL